MILISIDLAQVAFQCENFFVDLNLEILNFMLFYEDNKKLHRRNYFCRSFRFWLMHFYFFLVTFIGTQIISWNCRCYWSFFCSLSCLFWILELQGLILEAIIMFYLSLTSNFLTVAYQFTNQKISSSMYFCAVPSNTIFALSFR